MLVPLLVERSAELLEYMTLRFRNPVRLGIRLGAARIGWLPMTLVISGLFLQRMTRGPMLEVGVLPVALRRV